VLRRDFEFSEDEADNIMEKVLSFVTLVKPTRKVKIVKSDPDDNKIIECAMASSSKYIVTYDRHLLNIKEHEEIKILTPEELLKFDALK